MDKQFVAIIAHDAKKEELIELLKTHKEELSHTELVATRVTGQLVQSRTGLEVNIVASQRNGGDIQLAALVVGGEVSAVIFLRDPLSVQPYEPDIDIILRACDIHGVPLATNRATAEILLDSQAVKSAWISSHHAVADYLDEIADLQD